jgi:hypothetical protein
MADFPFYDLKILLGRANITKDAARRQSALQLNPTGDGDYGKRKMITPHNFCLNAYYFLRPARAMARLPTFKI